MMQYKRILGLMIATLCFGFDLDYFCIPLLLILKS